MIKKISLCIIFLVACLLPAGAVVLVVQVNMSNQTINSAGVHVMGTFNSWNPNGPLMTSLGGGIYEQSFTVYANSTVQFKFVNGANASDAENLPSSCTVSGNRSVSIGTENILVGPYCFGECADCVSIEPTTVNVTFRVDMTGQNVDANGVHIAGNFQNWNPASTAMNPLGGGIYSCTVAVPVGNEVLYKFINGNAWTGAEIVPSTCGQDDGFGAFNRNLNIGNADVTLDAVCFSSCEACTNNISTDSRNEVGIFPNPCSETINITGLSSGNRILIRDISGRIVFQTEKCKNRESLDISDFPTGVYILSTFKADAEQHIRFVKH